MKKRRANGGGTATERRGNGNGRAGWTLVDFAELEAWREAQGMPKTTLARELGVTNSTYHNWARGAAVATPRTQERMRQLMEGGLVERQAPVDKPALLEATGEIVAAYARHAAGGKALDIDGLVALIKTVRSALA